MAIQRHAGRFFTTELVAAFTPALGVVFEIASAFTELPEAALLAACRSCIARFIRQLS